MRYRWFVLCISAPLSALLLPYELPSYWKTYQEMRAAGAISEQAWYRVCDAEVVHRFMTHEAAVGSLFLYCPAQEVVREMRPLVFFVVHGTWARGHHEFCDVRHHLFSQVLDFVHALAVRHQRPVEVVSYQWSGVDSHEARRKAGDELRRLANSFYSRRDGYGSLWGYGHSHGVSVLCAASEGVLFDAILSLGAPVMEDSYTPVQVKEFFHLYSSNDPWQYAGSFDRRTIKRFFTWRGGGRVFEGDRLMQRGRMINVRLQFDGMEPGHISLKKMMPYLWELFDELSSHYSYHTHFDADIRMAGRVRAHRAVTVTIRESVAPATIADWVKEGKDPAEVIHQIAAEVAHSEALERSFAFRHRGRLPRERSSLARQFLANWLEYAELMRDVLPTLFAQKKGGTTLFSLDDEER